MATPYKRLTAAAFSALASTTLGALRPYQIRQVQEVLDRIAWGNANSNAGQGSDSDVSHQPTITQIITLLGANNP